MAIIFQKEGNVHYTHFVTPFKVQQVICRHLSSHGCPGFTRLLRSECCVGAQCSIHCGVRRMSLRTHPITTRLRSPNWLQKLLLRQARCDTHLLGLMIWSPKRLLCVFDFICFGRTVFIIRLFFSWVNDMHGNNLQVHSDKQDFLLLAEQAHCDWNLNKYCRTSCKSFCQDILRLQHSTQNNFLS